MGTAPASALATRFKDSPTNPDFASGVATIELDEMEKLRTVVAFAVTVAANELDAKCTV